MKKKLLGALVGAAVLVSAGVYAATQTDTFIVDVTVISSCTIVANDLHFGTYVAGQTTNLDAQSTFTIDCPAPYLLNADNGANGVRNMNSAGNLLPYELYTSAARITRLDAPGGGSIVGVPNVPGTPSNVDYFGTIAANLTPVAGAYADTVTATITY